MGVGKTSTARALGEALGWPVADSDDDIKALAGVAGVIVADRLGVPALHQIERAVLIAALARTEPHVIAAAASIVDNAPTRELLRDADVIRLNADIPTIHQRQRTGAHRRPMPLEELVALAERREHLFAEVEDLCLDAADPVEVLVTQILNFRKITDPLEPR